MVPMDNWGFHGISSFLWESSSMVHKRETYIKRVALFLSVLLSVLLTITLVNYHFFNSSESLFVNSLFEIAYTVMMISSIFLVNLPVLEWIEKMGVSDSRILKKIVLVLIITTVLTLIIIVGWVYFFDYHVHYGDLSSQLKKNIFIALSTNTIIFLTIQLTTIVHRWNRMKITAKELESEIIRTRYEVLKNQINPHFLFNSLNTLSSLIYLSQKRAVQYVDNFSAMFRYILEMQDRNVVKLAEELTFLKSYIELQVIQFDSSLTVSITVDEKWMNHYLPPMTIQMIVENVFKHNEISDDYPMEITVVVENGFVIISNPIQLKQSKLYSSGVGLSNIPQRYSQLTDIEPQFYVKDTTYIAKLPLIERDE